MKLPVVISSAVGIFALIGGLYAFDCTYSRAEDHNNLKTRFEQNMLRDEARDLRRRMWDMKRFYGEEKASSLREYQELEEDRNEVLRRLEK
jgi:hypothetical protein